MFFRRRFLCALLAGLSLPVLPAAVRAAQPAEPVLVQDVAPGTAPFSAFVSLYDAKSGAVTYFSASDPIHGIELWRTDGTVAGTFRLTDVCPGPCNAEPGSIEVFRGEIYFSAGDGVSGRELWATTDRPGTSRRVRDLCPGPCSGDPNDLAVVGGRLYFEAGAGAGRGLWTSDGTRGGTRLVRNLCAQGECTFGLYRVGGGVLFQRENILLGVWRSDGTAAGTGPFSDLVPGFPDYVNIVPAGDGTAFVWGDDSLWKTDGTAAGTRRLKTKAELGITSNDGFVGWSRSAVWKGMLITVRSGFAGGEIVRSDGTPEGTVKIGEIPNGGNLIGFAPLEQSLLFLLQSPETVWSTAGTAETTRQVVELPGYVRGIAPLRDQAAICLIGSSEQSELWYSDGTAAGTRRADEAPVGCSYDPAPVGSRLVFTDDLGKLWVTDGTAAGIFPLHDFVDLPASGGPREQIALGGQLLFPSSMSRTEEPLFVSDGTPAGTHEISGTAGWGREFARVGGRVFFEAARMVDENGSGYLTRKSLGLWTTDGTAAGTVQVDPRIDGYGSPVAAGSSLFFRAAREHSYYGDPDLELFRSDGSLAGTGLVKNIDRFSADTGHHHICYGEGSIPGPGIALGGHLIFAADDGARGRELWTSDGTRAGTLLLRDVDPRRLDGAPVGSCDDRLRTGVGSEPRDFLRFRDGVLFTAGDAAAGRELWWTDGTVAGTRRVADLRPGAQGSEPHDLVLFRGRVWFVASGEGQGEDLWRTDGTPQGTVRVRRLAVQSAPSWARSLTVAGGQLFFVLSGEEAGPELWVTGGTGPSTHRVADLRPGPAGSYPQSLTAAGGLLIFAADDGVHGLEAWQSDGTAEGTVLLGDVNPGLDASAPGPFTQVTAGLVLSGADDGEHGRELWAYRQSP